MALSNNELKIGNYVYCDNDDKQSVEIIRLKTICAQIKYKLNEQERYSMADYVRLSGIPLAEEWISKLSFKQQGKRKMWIKEIICLTLHEDGFFYLGLKDLGNVLFHSIVKVQYVHQLQNLYFDLTEKELKL